MPLPGSADVVVVGAGLAGLAAAVRLQEAGVDTVVVEAAEAVGGRVRTDVVDGFRLDRGFQLLNPAYPEAERLLDLDALDLRAFDAGLAVARDGRRYILGDPLRMPSALPVDLTAPVGSVRAKASFGSWAAGLGLGSADSIRERPDRSLMDELRARGLDGALTDRVLRPFLSGVLADASWRRRSGWPRCCCAPSPVAIRRCRTVACRRSPTSWPPGWRRTRCTSASAPGPWRATGSTPTRDGSRRLPWSSRPTRSRPPRSAPCRRRRCDR